MLRFLIMHVRNLSRNGEVQNPHLRQSSEAGTGLTRPCAQANVTTGDRAADPACSDTQAAPRRADAQGSTWSVSHRSVLPIVLAWLTSLPIGCACFRRDGHEANIVAARQMQLKGIDAQQGGRWEEAEALFADALRRNPADERAHCHFAQVMWQRGRMDAAIRHLEESVRLSGGDAQLVVQLGQMHLCQGNLEAAWECANEAVATNCHFAGAWALRGDVLRAEQNWDGALESYHRALGEQPIFPAVQLATAEVYRAQNRPRRALATLDSLESQLGPRAAPVELFYQQGLAYKALGRYQDSVAVLTIASRHPQSSADVLYHLSEAHLLAGNSASAKLAIQAALQRSPQHWPSIQLQEQIDLHQRSLTASANR